MMQERRPCQFPVCNGLSSTEVQLPAVLAPWAIYEGLFHVTNDAIPSLHSLSCPLCEARMLFQTWSHTHRHTGAKGKVGS